MEPKRVLIVQNIALKAGLELPPWSYVWQLAPAANGLITIEHRNQEYQIPAHCAVDVPVAPPSKRQLCTQDPCFATIGENFTQVYRDESRMFTIYRCLHGNYFLEDVRGGIGMFSLWVFLGAVGHQRDGGWESLWSKYHHMPTDAIFYLGIGC